MHLLCYINYMIVDIDISATNCVDGEVRLVGGSSEYEGRVEICINRVWGTVCATDTRSWWWWWNPRYDWGTPDSTVVCRQLGHPELGIYYMSM